MIQTIMNKYDRNKILQDERNDIITGSEERTLDFSDTHNWT